MSQTAIGISNLATGRPRPAARSRLIGHVKIISGLTLVSRILGILRESVIARYFGAGVVSSAFTAAFKVPNLFRKLLGEGALSATFIPLYAQALKDDVEGANRFAAASVNLLAMILIGLTIFGEAAIWIVARCIDLRPDDLLIVRFTAIMLPYVLLICGTAFLSGILQVHHRFALPAAAPILLNVIHICVIVLGAKMLMLGRLSGQELIDKQTQLGYWLSGFVLLAGCGQVAMLLPSLRAVGFRFGWISNFWSPMVANMLRLSVPVALSTGVLQASVVIDTLITALFTGEKGAGQMHILGHAMNYPMAVGAMARLYWAQMLYTFPLGVFATALATAIFPRLSGHAQSSDHERFKRVLRQGILFALFEGLPASIGLIIIRYPAIRLLFERDQFKPSDTQWVALSLVFYSAGIWAFSVQLILNRAYYALHDMTTPLVLSIVTLVVNTVVEIPLCFTRLGEAGMAAGTLVSFTLQVLIMLWMLDRKVGGIGLTKLLGGTCKMLVACGVMSVLCFAARDNVVFPKGSGHWASLQQLAILITVGGITYAVVCWATGLFHEIRQNSQSSGGENHSQDNGHE